MTILNVLDMSWRVAKEYAERRFGSAAREQVIMFLADKTSDGGSGVWCLKRTPQRYTEPGESTVRWTVTCIGNDACPVVAWHSLATQLPCYIVF